MKRLFFSSVFITLFVFAFPAFAASPFVKITYDNRKTPKSASDDLIVGVVSGFNSGRAWFYQFDLFTNAPVNSFSFGTQYGFKRNASTFKFSYSAYVVLDSDNGSQDCARGTYQKCRALSEAAWEGRFVNFNPAMGTIDYTGWKLPPDNSGIQKQLAQSLIDAERIQAELEKQPDAMIPGFPLARTLAVGSMGDDVKGLQTYLARFPNIYPEATITGYYGALTEKAIKKVQAANNLEQVGFVGPKTRELLNAKVASGGSL